MRPSLRRPTSNALAARGDLFARLEDGCTAESWLKGRWGCQSDLFTLRRWIFLGFADRRYGLNTTRLRA